MRRLVLVLVLANVLMFGWNRGWFDGSGGSPAGVTEENAHRLRPVPLSRLEAPQAPSSSPRASPPPAAPPRTPAASPQAPVAAPVPRSTPPELPAAVATPAPTPAQQVDAASTPSSPVPAAQPANGHPPTPTSNDERSLPAPNSPAEPAADASRVATPLVSAVCRAFPPIDEERAQALQLALEQSGARVDARRTEQGASYLVYLPPAASAAEAQQRLVELRRIGRDDAFVIQDGPMRMSISLGLFRFESAARSMVEQLARAGETRALIAPRPPIQVRIALQARWPQVESAMIASMLGAQFDAPARDCE